MISINKEVRSPRGFSGPIQPLDHFESVILSEKQASEYSIVEVLSKQKFAVLKSPHIVLASTHRIRAVSDLCTYNKKYALAEQKAKSLQLPLPRLD
jgi:hypothetical protein